MLDHSEGIDETIVRPIAVKTYRMTIVQFQRGT